MRDFNKKVYLERVLRLGYTYLASSSIRITKLVFWVNIIGPRNYDKQFLKLTRFFFFLRAFSFLQKPILMKYEKSCMESTRIKYMTPITQNMSITYTKYSFLLVLCSSVLTTNHNPTKFTPNMYAAWKYMRENI